MGPEDLHVGVDLPLARIGSFCVGDRAHHKRAHWMPPNRARRFIQGLLTALYVLAFAGDPPDRAFVSRARDELLAVGGPCR